MPAPSRATQRANREAAALGYIGRRGGVAGAAAARKRLERENPRRARRLESNYRRDRALRSEGVGGGYNEWRRITRDRGPDHVYMAGSEIDPPRFGNYREMLSRAIEQGDERANRWDSDFNRLYRAALADNFRHTRRGPYHHLLIYLGWREASDAKRWGPGNTPSAEERGFSGGEYIEIE